MNADDLILVSVDDHVVEPPDLFEGRLSKKAAEIAPRVESTEGGRDVWTFQGAPLPNVGLNAVADGTAMVTENVYDTPTGAQCPAVWPSVAQQLGFGGAARRPALRTGPHASARQAVGAGWRLADYEHARRRAGQVKPLVVSKDYTNTDPDGIPVLWAKFVGGAASARFHRPRPGDSPDVEDFMFAAIRHLGWFAARVRFWTMEPDREVVARAPDGAAGANALGRRGEEYVIQVVGGRGGDLALRLPPGAYRVWWVDPRTGRFLGRSISGFAERYPLPVQVRWWQEAGLRRVRTKLLSNGAAVFALALPAFAQTKNLLNLDKSGLAIQGYDPVAFFTESKPVKGKPVLGLRHNGALYYFASKANRDALLTALKEKTFGGWPSEDTPLEARLAFSAQREGLQFRAWDFTSQHDVRLRVYLLETTKATGAQTVALEVLGPMNWSNWLGTVRVAFGDELKEELQGPDSPAPQPARDPRRNGFGVLPATRQSGLPHVQRANDLKPAVGLK